MTHARRSLQGLPLALFLSGCGSPAPTAPAAVSTPATTTIPVPAAFAASLTGSWTGTAEDSQGPARVTWALTQSGNDVIGTVTTQALDPNDGSCGSCHRNKSGTFAGTVSGETLSLTMFFAAGANGDPTPACSATLTGSAATGAIDELAARYSGSDTCEGPFDDGRVVMKRLQ